MSRTKLPNNYYDGRTARKTGIEKSCNPHQGMTKSWSWWLAGWNDADMEIRNGI